MVDNIPNLALTLREDLKVTTMQEALHTIGETAEMFGLTVRTLHHWDDIGLVTPTARDWQDFRLYSAADIARIHDVLTYRAVGLKLREISEILEATDGSVQQRLTHQRDVLLQKQDELSGMLCALEVLLEETMQDGNLSAEKRAEIMGPYYRPELEAEAEEKWGETEEWAQSQAVQRSMTASDWQNLRERSDEHQQQLVQAMQRGVKPGSVEANELAEQHRQLLSHWFPVTISKHVIIARGYIADPRFKNYYDAYAPGLADWLFRIIAAQAQASGIDPDNACWQ